MGFIYKDSGSDIKTNIFRINDRYITKEIKRKKGIFKIALIPFSNNENILDIDVFDRLDGKHIAINGINQEDKYIGFVKDILEELVDLEVDIVVFPEMVFTQRMINAVKEVLKNNRGKFILIVCGTIWENRSNTCITLGGNGIEVGNQKKLNRYRTDKNYIEDIDLISSEKIIQIYDLEGFGRFCTPICVDFIESDYFNNITNIGVNLCLVPTYTPSLERFKENAKILGGKNFGGVFLSNYCGVAKSNDISFAYIPRKKNSLCPIMCEDTRCKNGLCYKNFIIEF